MNAVNGVTTGRTAPGPKGLPLIGNLFDAWRDPRVFFTESIRDFGDLVEFQFGPYKYLLLNDLDAVKHVLVDHPKNYTKSRSYKGIKLLLGQGLLTSEGDFWRRQRKLAQPAFHREKLAGFVETMARATEKMLERWEESATTRMDVHEEMMRLTFHIVGLTLFSTNLDENADAVGKALAVALPFANNYATSLLPIPPWVPTEANLRFRRAKKTMNDMVFGLISKRRTMETKPNDLLSMLMDVKDDAGEGMNDQQLRDEAMTMVLAGHETTANALAWTWYLLSKHPEAARRVEREVREVLDGGSPTLDDLSKLSYTRMVIEESMRLYPPAWAFERQAIEDDVVAGFAVPKGTLIGICPFTLHRKSEYWENPEGFDPERFTPERVAARPRYSYLPFGGGPRFCIGSAFAMMELQIIVAMVAQKHSLELLPGTNPALVPEVTLRPEGGIPMERKPVRDGMRMPSKRPGDPAKSQAPRATAMSSVFSAASAGVIPTG
jgi:cytochrome P450